MPMPEPTPPLHQAIDEVAAASDALCRTLARYKAAVTMIPDHIQEGRPVVDILDQLQMASGRRDITEAVSRFQSTRHRLRVALLERGLSEGATIADMGRALGVSRQFASRLASELDP